MIGESLYTIAKRSQFGAVAIICAITLLAPIAAQAQGDPTSNVNVVGMTPDPADFPDLRYRQQNEPACAIRPGDSACIICAYNDYRGVDSDSGSPSSGFGFGDSWQGVSQSCTAGDTWRSRLAPGYPGDPTIPPSTRPPKPENPIESPIGARPPRPTPPIYKPPLTPSLPARLPSSQPAPRR